MHRLPAVTIAVALALALALAAAGLLPRSAEAHRVNCAAFPAYVWVQGDGQLEMLDWWMVSLGYARAWTADGQHRDAIVAAQDDATASGRGCLWGA